MAHKILRKINFAVMAMGGFLLVAYVIMLTPWFRHILERRVIADVENATGGRAEVREFRFRPLVFQVILQGFVLHGSEKPSASPLFAAESVVLGIDPTSVFRQSVNLRNLAWDKAEVHVYRNPDGSTTLPEPHPTGDGPGTLRDILNLSIGSITILHTSVFFNDQKIPLNVTARDVAFQLRSNLLHHFQGSYSSSQTSAKDNQWELLVATVAAQFHFSRSDFTLDSLTLRSPGFNGTCALKLKALPEVEANLTYSANGDILEMGRALRLGSGGAGKLTLHGGATYHKGGWSVQGQIQARQFVVPAKGFNPGRIDVSANYSGTEQHLKFSNLKISALGGNAQGEGEITFQGNLPAFTLHTQIRGFDMALAVRAFPHMLKVSTYLHPAGLIGGTIDTTWKGRLNDFESKFNLQFSPLENVSGDSLLVGGMARGKAVLDRGLRVQFDDARLQTPYSSLLAQGTAAEADSELSVRFTTSEFREWRHLAEYLIQASEPIPLELKSQATFTGTVTGPIFATDIRGRLETGPFDYRGGSWDSFSGSVGATHDYVEITSGRLRAGTSSLIIDTSVHLNDWVLTQDAPAHLTASAQHLSIEALQTSLRLTYPIKGNLTGQIDLEGTPRNPTGKGQIQIDRGQIFQQPFDSLSAKVSVIGSAWRLDNIQMASGPGRVTGEAQYSQAQRNLSVELHGRSFSEELVKSIAQLEGLGPMAKNIGVGATSFDLRGHGVPEDLTVSSSVDIREVKIHGTPVGDLHGQLGLEGQRLQFQLQAKGEGGTVDLNGTAQTKGDWPLDMKGTFTDFRGDPWIQLVSGNKFNARVIGTGTVKAKGPLKDTSRLEANSETTKLEVNIADLAWSNGGPIELHYAQRVLSARPFQMRGPSTNLEVEGSIHFGNQAELTLSAHGESDNTLLSLLDPAIHATGRSKLDLNLRGSPMQPLLNGTLKVQDLNLAYGDFPFHLSGLTGDIQLEGDRATAKSLRGQIGGGIVTLTGFLTFAQTPRFDFRANLDQVRVQYPADFTSLLAGDLNLVGSTDGGRLQGDITIRQMFASENFNVLNMLSQVNAPGGAPSNITSSSFASKIRLDVSASSDPDVRLETHDLRLVADVDMSLQGTLANPVELGTIHILNGEALVRGNHYHLDRGDVTMANPFRTQPILDLQARTRIQRYDLTMDISGPFEQMKIAYRTDPPLPTSDILSLLALGYVRNTGELAPTSGGFSNEGASALLSEALSSQTTGRIQRIFGVSRIKIDPNVGDPANISGTRVTIEQQVSRDLTLTYATNTGSTQQRVIQFEWALSDRLSLIGVRDQNGIFGTEIIIRRRFK